jgi:hypothetical protein|tara:strand:- start:1630 stop:2085 length:456 start_codon:yes stop_codon:yes gene_type:complete
MKEFFNNLQSRERNLIILLVSIIVLGILLSITTNLYSNLKDSKLRLASQKSDYNYVFNQAKGLSLDLAQKNFELNSKDVLLQIEKLADSYQLINYSYQINNSELEIIYILNDLEPSLLFINDLVSLIGLIPGSIEVARLNEIKRFTLTFSI